jgi:hypothetical protein
MSIHDFYSRLVSVNEENVLLGTLRKLSLLEDPKSMFTEEPLGEWIPWGDPTSSASEMTA